jgi:hypothetical protein
MEEHLNSSCFQSAFLTSETTWNSLIEEEFEGARGSRPMRDCRMLLRSVEILKGIEVGLSRPNARFSGHYSSIKTHSFCLPEVCKCSSRVEEYRGQDLASPSCSAACYLRAKRLSFIVVSPPCMPLVFGAKGVCRPRGFQGGRDYRQERDCRV